MSVVQEPNIGDLVAVACVVDSSLLLASEWSRVLIEYVYPLLKRLNELHPSHQFRLAFVTYGAADTWPRPIISKIFFAPLSQVSKLLREEPLELGIGKTNSGSRGLSALEGLVAAIEIFDILMTSTNFAVSHAQTQSPQKESRSLISHLLHIAASPPDNAQRPHWNTLQHLDSVNWDSIPAELKKRKINLSLISLRKITQFQELQSSVAGSGAQSPWFNVRAPHILSLAGFPVPKTGTKRQTDVLPSDQSPDSKRQKVVADTIPKPSPASPALSPARPPQNRSQQPIPLQVPQPTPISGQNSSPAQPIQSTPTIPSSTPAVGVATPLPPSAPHMPHVNPQVLDQVVTAGGIKFGQMMERLRLLEKELAEIESQISSTQNAGQAAILDGLQKDRDSKARIKEQIKAFLRGHYQKMMQAKEAMTAQTGAAGSAPQDGSAEAGPSSQSYPPSAPGISSERSAGPTIDEQKPPMTEMMTQFWQSRGATGGATTSQTTSRQNQSYSTITPQVAAMQKLMEMKGIRPPNFGPSQMGTNPNETSGTSNAANTQYIQAGNPSAWYGTFSASFPNFGGQATNEMQMHVVGFFDQPTRTDNWPKNLDLKACKEPLKDNQELTSWLKHQTWTRKIQFKPNARAPDGSINEQKFQALYKFMTESRIYAYAGLQIPSSKFIYIVIFPVQSCFAGVIFPDSLPELPGSGNVLGGPRQPEVTEPLPFSGLNLPQPLIARMQTLEPAQRKQLLAQFLRAQQLRRQQLQQAQQPLTTLSQAANSHGMPTPYRGVATMPPGLATNVNVPANAGALNTGGGTVNYEMLQSFMQRNAEGSTPQGTNLG